MLKKDEKKHVLKINSQNRNCVEGLSKIMFKVDTFVTRCES